MAEKTARTVALETLYKVETEGYKADITLHREQQAIEEDFREKALAMELCYGVLRWRLKLDHILRQFYKGELEKLNPRILNILRMGAYQLLFLDRVPPWAALDECVKLAHRYGHRGIAALVNGVLRSISRARDNIKYPSLSGSALKYVAVNYSHPEWLVERWIAKYGVDETMAICEANNQIPPLTVRANRLRTTPNELAEDLEVEGVKVVPCKYAGMGMKIYGCGAPAELDAFQRGCLQVQDEASMLAAQLLTPLEGMRVLDCCAGLGGKASFAAEAMRNRGLVVALDINHRRLSMLMGNCQRLGIDIIYPVVIDSSVELKLTGFFDAVLVDAPCSDLGVLHRHPEIKWRRKKEDLVRLQALQLEILENACRHVKPEGVMVYSTCTVEPEENQDVVKSFLSTHPEFRVEAAGDFLPPEARKLVTPEGFFFTFPHREDLDGFFAVRMKRSRKG